MKVNHVIGPPGTGKTSYLMGYGDQGIHVTGQVEKAASKFGTANVLCVTLTKAAAAEVSSRSKILARDRMGNLHSVLFQELGRPALVTPDQVDEFSAEHPAYRISPSEVCSEGASDSEGTGLFQAYDLTRAQMIPVDVWPKRLVELDELWRGYKAEVGASDFTDLIEAAAWGQIDPLPIKAAFVDEAQDLSALEWEAMRWICQDAESLTQVGDPLQALYAWRGADPEALLGDCDFKKVMPRSYRVPRGPHAEAIKVVSGLPGSEAEYQPDDRDGTVERPPWSLAKVRSIADDVEYAIDHAESIMILASCGYMLSPLRRELRRRGIPFHNPYAPRNGGWNPLADRGLVSAVSAFFRPFSRPREPLWSHAEIRSWSKQLAAGGVFKRGWKKVMVGLDEIDTTFSDEGAGRNRAAALAAGLEEEAHGALMAGDLEWYLDHVLRQNEHFKYVGSVLARQSPKRFVYELAQPAKRRPWALIGSIHSVKGGEADNVHVYPDLSPRGCKTYSQPGWEHRESIHRMMYVARTRARRRLVLGRPMKVVRSFRG